VLRGHAGEVFSAAFSPDSWRIVSASADRTARVWDAGSVARIAVLRGHEGMVTSAAFSPDGRRIVSASWDRTVRAWDADGSQITVLRGHDDSVTSAAFSPDGRRRIVSASTDDTVRLWDAGSGAKIGVLSGHEGRFFSAAFSPDGLRIVSASTDDSVRVWGAGSGAQMAALRRHTDSVSSATFSPDGRRIISGSWDKTVQGRRWMRRCAAEPAPRRPAVRVGGTRGRPCGDAGGVGRGGGAAGASACRRRERRSDSRGETAAGLVAPGRVFDAGLLERPLHFRLDVSPQAVEGVVRLAVPLGQFMFGDFILDATHGQSPREVDARRLEITAGDLEPTGARGANGGEEFSRVSKAAGFAPHIPRRSA
jgi:dipeptidyl aminopeptidase/acylaminoacyl peptidase